MESPLWLDSLALPDPTWILPAISFLNFFLARNCVKVLKIGIGNPSVNKPGKTTQKSERKKSQISGLLKRNNVNLTRIKTLKNETSDSVAKIGVDTAENELWKESRQITKPKRMSIN